MIIETVFLTTALAWNSLVQFHAPSIGTVIALMTALVLIVVSGFVSASETAFFALSPEDLDRVSDHEKPIDSRVEKLLSDSERLLATILITNNLVNVAIILLLDLSIGQMVDFGNSVWLEFLVVTVLLTFILLLCGEIMPKLYSSHNALSFARIAAPFLSGAMIVFRPIASLLISSGKITSKIAREKNIPISVDQLEHALELTDSSEIRDEQEMLEGVIRFGDETVVDIMTSRVDMVMLDIKAPFPAVMKCIEENFYSRVPVYSGTSDNIKGILFIKDLIPYLDKGETFRWQSLVRPAFFVPETRKVVDLLHDFQTGRIHMAIVVDEFGGTCGLATLEDIIEEILGEINDEFDEDSVSYRKIGRDTFVFEGKTPLADFFKTVDLDESDYADMTGEADTLAGWLLEMKGDFPRKDEEFECGDIRFKVLEKKERRISGIRVVIHKEPVLKDNN